MQNDYKAKGVVIVGVTGALPLEAERFLLESSLNYPVLADGEAIKQAWGVKKLWGSVVYLIDRDGNVLVRGIEETLAELDKRTRES